MRDRRFVAVHRGGPLTRVRHFQLMQWARDCAEHVLPLCGNTIDDRLTKALKVAKEWKKGKASVGDARQAAVGAIAAARASSNPVRAVVARGVGHAVATAHMADHSLGAAYYALKAVKLSAKSVERERKWQNRHLPKGIRQLVLSARTERHI